ncbi:MAG TPA: hypothetical protein VEI52_08450 [Terriglobales bacterium]|nr:hypothetical protein [Terriglobales bacterium]
MAHWSNWQNIAETSRFGSLGKRRPAVEIVDQGPPPDISEASNGDDILIGHYGSGWCGRHVPGNLEGRNLRVMTLKQGSW